MFFFAFFGVGAAVGPFGAVFAGCGVWHVWWGALLLLVMMSKPTGAFSQRECLNVGRRLEKEKEKEKKFGGFENIPLKELVSLLAGSIISNNLSPTTNPPILS